MLDWAAGAVELAGSWLVGSKRRVGFLLAALCDVLWIAVALRTGVYGLLLVVVPAFFIALRNWWKWGRHGGRG